MMDGVLLFNKPPRWTSHDAVDFLRRRLNVKKAGHAGTLDPMATGLLVMLLGKATKLSAELTGLEKDYRGTVLLGRVTDTWDLQGKVLSESPVAGIRRDAVEREVAAMRGALSIIPPAFSALKKEGVRYYEMARKGVVLEPPAREVTIIDFRVESFALPEVGFFVSCSKGTYVRSLAHRLGEKLGCGACLSSLERTRVGDFHLRDALTREDIEELSIPEISKRIRHSEGRSDEESMRKDSSLRSE